MIYRVVVKPGSFKDEIIDTEEGKLIVKTRKKARDGEANKSVVELLAKHFGVGKTKIQIVKGATSKHKTIEITG
ncbi:DUF167 domain-containing protein [Candidatus Saccharibacteria bacterium]|nr:DUF167 domain-containing protein [Candidatus Saccharibacteria bacterium]